MNNMDKLLAQITIAVNDELMKHNALTHQIEYLKKRANLQLFNPQRVNCAQTSLTIWNLS